MKLILSGQRFGKQAAMNNAIEEARARGETVHVASASDPRPPERFPYVAGSHSTWVERVFLDGALAEFRHESPLPELSPEEAEKLDRYFDKWRDGLTNPAFARLTGRECDT